MPEIKLTPFQGRVFKAVLRIPIGQTRSYKWVAKKIKRPKATRAVARALANNPLALIIPCHRVICSDGKISGYRWGVRTKKRLLELEKRMIEKMK